jgi:hypothetical protein
VNFGVRDTIGPQPMMARATPMGLEAATPPTLESGRSIERLTRTGTRGCSGRRAEVRGRASDTIRP